MKKRSAWKQLLAAFETKLLAEGHSFLRRKDLEESGVEKFYCIDNYKGGILISQSKGYMVFFDIVSSHEPKYWPPIEFHNIGCNDRLKVSLNQPNWSISIGDIVGRGNDQWILYTDHKRNDVEGGIQEVVEEWFKMLNTHGFKLLSLITQGSSMPLKQFIDDNRDESYLPKISSALKIAKSIHDDTDFNGKLSKLLAKTNVECAEAIETHVERQRGTPLLPKEDEEEALRLAEEIRNHALKFL